MSGNAEGTEERALTPRLLIVAVAWFAAVAAILELTGRGISKYVAGDVLRVSRDVVWMAPLGQFMLFAPVAAVLALLFAIRRKPLTLPTLAGAFVFLSALGVLLLPDGMHPIGGLLLALGAGVQATRSLKTRAGPFATVMRRTLPLLVAVLTAGGAGTVALRMLRERQAVAALPDARAGAPNVILLIWDTVRAQSLSLYGHARSTTPNLDRLAKSGVVFDRAIAPTSWTLPSHASMFTGYPSHQLAVGWIRPLGSTPRTLAEAFRDAGYMTGGFAANVLYTDWEHGLARGFQHYEDYTRGLGQIFLSTSLGFRIAKGRHGWERAPIPYVLGYRQFVGRRLGESVDEEFLKWVDERGDRPFFAFLNYFDAHLPYEPPAPFDTLFGPPRPKTTPVGRLRNFVVGTTFWAALTTEALAAEHAKYEASIAYLDYRLGELTKELERRDLLDNTIIVITSDHGEEFLEHGDHEHGSNLYLTQIHVPLVVLYPGRVPEGARVASPVSLRNIAATIASLSGLPDAATFPGRSLEAWWTTPQSGGVAIEREMAVSDLKVRIGQSPRVYSLMLDSTHFIRNIDGSIELYDLAADPLERSNLVASSDTVASLRPWYRALGDVLSCDGRDCCCQAPPGLSPSGPAGHAPSTEADAAVQRTRARNR